MPNLVIRLQYAIVYNYYLSYKRLNFFTKLPKVRFEVYYAY